MRVLVARTAKTLGTNALVAATSLLTALLLARSLGPTGRGEVAAALLWPTLLTYVFSTGLVSTIAVFRAQPNGQAGSAGESGGDAPARLMGTAGGLALVQSLAAITAGFILLPFLLSGEPASVVRDSRLYLAVVPISLLSLYGGALLQGSLRLSAYNRTRLVVPSAAFIGVVALLLGGSVSVAHVLFVQFAANGLCLLVTFIVLTRDRTPGSMKPDRVLARSLLSFGFRVQLGDVSALANDRLDQVAMAAFLAPASLGLYVAAVSAASLPQTLTRAVSTVMLPSIASLNDAGERLQRLREIFSTYWWLSICACLATALLLPIALPLAFGPRFSGSLVPAEILVLGTLLIGGKEVLYFGAQALGKPWIGSRAEVVALVITGGLLIALLPPLGITGAAIASVGAYGAAFAASLLGLRRTFGIELLDMLRPPISLRLRTPLVAPR